MSDVILNRVAAGTMCALCRTSTTTVVVLHKSLDLFKRIFWALGCFRIVHPQERLSCGTYSFVESVHD